MLSRDEIQSALRADRFVELNVPNPHGPLGLEQLAAAVLNLANQRPERSGRIQRPISVPTDTWEKLSDLAIELSQRSSRQITASEVATSLLIQGLDSIDRS